MVPSIFPKNERKQVDSRYYSSLVDFFFFCFFEELRITISPFEINWSLIVTIDVLGSYIFNRNSRGLINGKAPTAAALPKFSDTLTLSQSGGEGADYPQPLTLPHLKFFVITPLNRNKIQIIFINWHFLQKINLKWKQLWPSKFFLLLLDTSF